MDTLCMYVRVYITYIYEYMCISIYIYIREHVGDLSSMDLFFKPVLHGLLECLCRWILLSTSVITFHIYLYIYICIYQLLLVDCNLQDGRLQGVAVTADWSRRIFADCETCKHHVLYFVKHKWSAEIYI